MVAVCHHSFPNVVFANEEIGLAREFFWQVAKGARVVNGKCVEQEFAYGEYSF